MRTKYLILGIIFIILGLIMWVVGVSVGNDITMQITAAQFLGEDTQDLEISLIIVWIITIVGINNHQLGIGIRYN